MRARVFIGLKPGVLDPAGKALEDGLHALGYAEVSQARLGKCIELSLEESDPKRARARVEEMCQKLLANPVVERFEVELE